MVLSWSRQQLFIFSLLLLLFMSYQLLNRFLKLQVFVRVPQVVKNNRQLSYKTITTKVNTTKLYHKLRKLTTTLLQNKIRTASTHYIEYRIMRSNVSCGGFKHFNPTANFQIDNVPGPSVSIHD